MPEGPEVRTLVDQLQPAVGMRLIDLEFLSGRYVRHGKPDTFVEFAQTMTRYHPSDSTTTHSTTSEHVDIIQKWSCKGKFLYMVLDDGSGNNHNHNNHNQKNDDFQRSIWMTLGMTGQFLTEAVHRKDPRHARWCLHLLDTPNSKDDKNSSIKRIYYHDQRNFGTLRFSLSKTELDQKLASLGPDLLDANFSQDDFLQAMEDRSKPTTNICQFLMDQSKVSGIGNYILSEGLYRARIDPFASLQELNEVLRRRLCTELVAVATESYQSQGLTRSRRDGGTHRNVDGQRETFNSNSSVMDETCVPTAIQ